VDDAPREVTKRILQILTNLKLKEITAYGVLNNGK
jgi:hypothetical protein